MLKKFLPNQYVKNIFQIHPEALREKGVKGIITDLDNTLVEWDRPNATPKLIEWFANMEKNDIKITIVSNNNDTRVKNFSEPLGIPFISRARKPLTRAFHDAVKQMELKKEETVIIGDQLLTDIFGGNRGGFYTILVIPVAQSDGFATRFNRMIERRLMAFFNRKGLIQWEDER
ncbi:YqeG family HAD IIIA-type phosphatase [Bacillus chungangensis]|uniref:HAD superfamily phosphatase (TIGR01668 family) n=1 Tax=Bacillus chungangensis TaxID=587633 RepID=A0ABT9WLQ6_9BACI|nr:YqeG family HAD IIIA-type phosphatase [Bacillus chungangensis]MDQ0174217.1 HAD superfamily phosphatase (TIGR01668 family) [Bacillus chungangensis]